MKNKILQLHNEPRLSWTLLCAIGIFLVAYVYCVNQTVFNIIKRQKFEIQISELSSKIGVLESQYISLKNGVTIDVAHALGFKNSSSEFVSRKSLGKGLSLNNEI